MSTANRIIGAHIAHIGTVDASIASPREVFKCALLVNARSIIVCHNHPNGNLEPSRATGPMRRSVMGLAGSQRQQAAISALAR